MNFTHLKHASSSTVKALFGLHPTVLAELLFNSTVDKSKDKACAKTDGLIQ